MTAPPERSFRVPAAEALAGGSMLVGAAAYLTVGRRPCLTWGATEDEINRALPGDDLLSDPDVVSTRAVTIDAPPTAIWPWIVQMGSGKGGMYTYDWIENALGLDMHSADTILPEFQSRKVGDLERLGKSGPRMRTEVLDPEQALVVRSEDGNWVWAFCLLPAAPGRTRLVSRNRISRPTSSVWQRMWWPLVMEPGSLIMERKMLLGIKHRAELGPDARGAPARPAHLTSLALLSCARTVTLLARRRLHLGGPRLGAIATLPGDRRFTVFRESSCDSAPPGERVTLAVWFHLRGIPPGSRFRRRAFERLCVMNTVLFAGFTGYVVKLWMVDPRTADFAGLYTWSGVDHAEIYADYITRVLEPVSVAGSVGHALIPASIDDYLDLGGRRTAAQDPSVAG